MLRVLSVTCALVLLAGCASTGPTMVKKQVSYLDADGKVQVKEVEVAVDAPRPANRPPAAPAESISGLFGH